MDSQSLSEEDIVASLILHRTGWSVWRSTVMLFPSTLGLSLISFTTWPTKWATWNTNFLNIPLTTHHHSMDGVNYTLHQTPILHTTLWMVLNYTRKRVSSAPCLGGRVRDSLPATYTFRMFLWSPEEIKLVGQRLCWVIYSFEEYEPIYRSITVSPDCLMQTWKGSWIQGTA